MDCILAFLNWLSQNRLPTPSDPPTSRARLLEHTEISMIYLTAPVVPLRVIKVSKDVSFARQEYQFHREIELAFLTVAQEFGDYGAELNLPRIPRCYAFYPKIRDSEYAGMFRGLEGAPNSCGIAMEYIRPFSHSHVQSLLKRHLSEVPLSCVPNDEHFLVKIYMGDTKPLSYGSTASFYSRAAYTDHLRSERVDNQSLSAIMGTTLAILHWRCGIDAAGVKFVFGRDNRGNIKLWLMDFGDCRTFQLSPADLMTQLVDAVLHNEPYWPRYIDLPGLRVAWTRFQTAYLRMSDLLLKDVSCGSGLRLLPGLFMDALETVQGPKGLFE
jgi:hypothetical protein